MTFHSIVEQWCRQYKYMRHNPKEGNKRFYLTDSTGGVVDMAKSISNEFSPFVMMESTVEGGGPIRCPKRNYPLYFFVRADKMADGDEAAVAKETAWMHAQNFVSWLLDKHDREMNENRNGDFARLDLDDAYLDIQTIGPIENGWFAVMIQFEREEPLNLCVNEDLYDDDCEC
jgi:hypothetical protein